MIALLAFPFIAALLVFAAGRKDAARDPRLTLCLLTLLAAFPLMAMWMPKIGLLPTSGGEKTGTAFPWMAILLSAWALGFLIAASRLALAALGLRNWRRRAIEIDRAQGIPVRKLDGLRSPVATGIFDPVIFVPGGWEEMPEPKRRMILAHEIAHHRRRDPLWRLCAELACAIHWYHPLVRWMAKRLAMQCEYACDAEVLRNGADAKAYAGLLCDFAGSRQAPPLALAMAETSSLEQRIVRMFQPGGSSGTAAIYLCGGLGLFAALALSMLGTKAPKSPGISPAEVHMRLTADPFPGE